MYSSGSGDTYITPEVRSDHVAWECLNPDGSTCTKPISLRQKSCPRCGATKEPHRSPALDRDDKKIGKYAGLYGRDGREFWKYKYEEDYGHGDYTY